MRFACLIVIFIFNILFCNADAIAIYNGSNPDQIALTFDDGPSFKYTPIVLDILKKENIKATFFVVGKKIEQYPDILSRIAKEGHDIGNHTYYHSRLTTLSKEHLTDELQLTSNLIDKITGKRVVFFRPPHGNFDKVSKRAVEKTGYGFVLWSVNADDFYHDGWGMRSAGSIKRRVLSGVKGGDIILAHDNSEQLAQALPGIIIELKKRGYKFVTLTELTHFNTAGVNKI